MDRPTQKDVAWLTGDDYMTIKGSIQEAPEGYLKLYHPEARGLVFGPAGELESGGAANIRFGQIEPHFAVVPEDHPLLDELFKRESRVVVVVDDHVWVDADTGREFPTKARLRAFQAEQAAKREPKEKPVPRPKASPPRGRSKNTSTAHKGAAVSTGVGPEGTSPDPDA